MKKIHTVVNASIAFLYSEVLKSNSPSALYDSKVPLGPPSDPSSSYILTKKCCQLFLCKEKVEKWLLVTKQRAPVSALAPETGCIEQEKTRTSVKAVSRHRTSRQGLFIIWRNNIMSTFRHFLATNKEKIWKGLMSIFFIME